MTTEDIFDIELLCTEFDVELGLIDDVDDIDNIVDFPELLPAPTVAPQKDKNYSAVYKSNGVRKATSADPIRNIKDVKRIQEYFLKKKQYRNYALFTLGISSMLRASDLLALTFTDVLNFKGKKPAPEDIKERITVREKKTGKKNEILINDHCRKALYKYICRVYSRERVAWFEEGAPLFYSETSVKQDPTRPKAISIQMLDKMLKRAQTDLGIEDHLSSHSMRKTMVYHTIKNNEYDQYTLYLLQRMLNHSDVKTTFRYCGMESESIEKIRRDIGSILDGE